jgi:hypothetical protein
MAIFAEYRLIAPERVKEVKIAYRLENVVGMVGRVNNGEKV